MTRQFIARRVSISSQLTERSRPSTQFLVILIAINKMEITIGKLSTAINMLLLFAFAAIPESMVNEAAKPQDVNKMVIENKNRSSIGLFKNKINRTKPVNERSSHRMKL